MKQHRYASRLVALALTLALLPLVAVFAGLPVAAAGNNRSVVIGRTDVEPELDGKVGAGEEWDSVAWSQDFTDAGGNSAAQEGFRARFKSMWRADGETRSLYFLVEVYDATPSQVSDDKWEKDGFVLLVDETGTRTQNPVVDPDATSRRNGTLSATKVQSSPVLTYGLNRTKTMYTLEIRYDFVKPAYCVPGGRFAFDLFIQDNCGTGNYRRLAWNGTTNVDSIANTGTGILSATPVSAGPAVDIQGAGHSYTLYRADGEMTLDGVAGEDEYWNNLPWSEPFEETYSNGTQTQDFGARFKAMWDEEGYLWLLLEIQDATAVDAENGQAGYVWTQDGFIFCISETGLGTGTVSTDLTAANASTDRRTSTLSSINPAWIQGGNASDWFSYALVRDETGVRIEARYTFYDAANATAGQRILLDVMAQDSLAEGQVQQLFWNSVKGQIASEDIRNAGEGWLSAVPASRVIPIQTQYGAAVRLSEPTGLRYETHLDKAAYDALVASGATVTTGTLILPTDYLTDNGVCAGALSAELLDELGVTYLDVVNSGWANADTAEADGYYCWYGSIVNIRPGNYDRAFTGVGYVRVELADGSVYTLYGGSTAEANSRSVRDVAQAALDSGDYDDDPEALKVLSGFASAAG